MPRLFLLLALTGLVASIDQDVSLRPRFVVGDEFTISMAFSVDERIDSTRNFSISRTIQVKVVSNAASGTILKWRPGVAQGGGKGVPQGPDVRRAIAMTVANIHDFLLELGADGQYRRVTNVAELTPSLDRAREAMEADVPAIKDPELAGLPKLTAAHIAATVGLDAEIFTTFYGLARPIGLALDVTDTFPWPGGGLPGVRRFNIVSANDESAEATMSFTLDQAALRKLNPPGVESADKIDLTESARYIFDRRAGLNRGGKLERTAIRGEDRRIERWEFSLTTAPKR